MRWEERVPKGFFRAAAALDLVLVLGIVVILSKSEVKKVDCFPLSLSVEILRLVIYYVRRLAYTKAFKKSTVWSVFRENINSNKVNEGLCVVKDKG